MSRCLNRFLAALLLLAWGTVLAANDASFTVTGFRVEGENPLSASETQRVLAPYAGEHRDIARLEAAAKALEAALHEEGWGFYRVVLPPQEVGATVTLKVLRSTIGTVAVKGEKNVSAENVRRSLPSLKEGTSPNLRYLARDISVSNESLVRQVNVGVKPGAATDTVDATVDVEDRRPWSVLFSADNSGYPQPATSRTSLALQHANLWGLDHVATVSYTTSPETPQSVKQYGAFYKAPIHSIASLVSAYWFRSTTNTGAVGGDFTVSGAGEFYGLSVTHHLLPWGSLRSRVTVAVDDKLFRNNTTFLGQLLGLDVRATPMTLSYQGQIEQSWGRGGFLVSYSSNLQRGAHNNDLSYAATRFEATPDWDAWRISANATAKLPKEFSLVGRVAGQFSSDSLIPGEQFGLGGMDSLRGLQPRQLIGDKGYQASVEIWSPALAEGLHGLLFYDFGQLWRNNPFPGTPSSENAADVGAGLRWQIGERYSVSLDAAMLTHDITGKTAGSGRVYASFAARF